MLRRIAYVRARAGVRPPARAGQHARLLATTPPRKDEPQGGTVNVRTGKAFGQALGESIGQLRKTHFIEGEENCHNSGAGAPPSTS